MTGESDGTAGNEESVAAVGEQLGAVAGATIGERLGRTLGRRLGVSALSKLSSTLTDQLDADSGSSEASEDDGDGS